MIEERLKKAAGIVVESPQELVTESPARALPAAALQPQNVHHNQVQLHIHALVPALCLNIVFQKLTAHQSVRHQRQAKLRNIAHSNHKLWKVNDLESGLIAFLSNFVAVLPPRTSVFSPKSRAMEYLHPKVLAVIFKIITQSFIYDPSRFIC